MEAKSVENEAMSTATQAIDGAVVFNPALEAALRELLPSKDPLDRPDFNPVEYINKRFPNEQSLGEVPDVLAKLKAKVRAIDTEIYDAVRRQASAGTRGTQDLTAAKLSIRELVTKVQDIKRKAEQSELMVQEICQDIQSLDWAKKNLSSTINVLQRLNFLVRGVENLRASVSQKNYAEAAGLFQAIVEYSHLFQNHRGIPKIKELQDTIAGIEMELKRQCYEDFDCYIRDDSKVIPVSDMQSVCLAIDAMGPKVRDDFIMWYCSKMLHDYKATFLRSADVSTLENIERRFAWLQSFLQEYEEKYQDVFPYYWQVEEIVCTSFCAKTKEDLIDVLLRYQTLDTVSVLLKGLQKALDFENQLVLRFSEHEAQPQAAVSKKGEQQLHPTKVEEIRRKYKGDQTTEEKPHSVRFAGGKPVPEDHDYNIHPLKVFSFEKVITSAFEPHMSLYIAMEDRDLGNLIQGFARDDWTVRDGESENAKQNQVFENCNILFMHLRKIMQRCVKFSKGKTYFDLFKLMKKHIKSYSDLMISKLPGPKAPATSGGLINPSMNSFLVPGSQTPVPDWYIKLSDTDIQTICLTINTSEYCLELLPSLAEGITRTIDPAFKDDVDLSNESEEFQNAISKAVGVLVTGLETKLDPFLITMAKFNWSTHETVADQSEYVNHLVSAMTSFVATVRITVSLIYFRFFCDKFIGSFIPKYTANIYKCKKITEAGAHQLLVDLIGLKTAILDLHSAGGPAMSQNAPASYTKVCQKELGKGEAILKVVMSPQESIVENFRTLIPEGVETDLQRIMDLRGWKRNEQQALLQRYTTHEAPRNYRQLFNALGS